MVLANEGQEQRRCDRNRKRSKRREILCPYHGIHLLGSSIFYAPNCPDDVKVRRAHLVCSFRF